MRFEMAPLAIESATSERTAFIRRTYAHLAGAILAFTLLEVALFKFLAPAFPGVDQALQNFVRSPISQLVVLLAFIGVSFLARYWASNGGSAAMQYAGLGLFVVAQAVIFVPILYIAIHYFSSTILLSAAILTLSLFAGLTAVVFITGKDFSFMASILTIASFLMLGIVLCVVALNWTNGFQTGWYFSMGIAIFGVMLAAGFILYDTSNIMLHFRTDQHVAASLELFSSIAYLFFQILRILMLTQSRD